MSACSLSTQGNDYADAVATGAGAGSSGTPSATASGSGSSVGAGGASGGAGGGIDTMASAGAGGESSASTTSGATSSSAGTGGGNPCPTGMGPEMVVVPASAASGNKSFCIDSTEVTVAQYATWLATFPSIDNEPSYCKSWNTDHAPKQKGTSCQFYNIAAASAINHPVSCINWCDANAYCQAAGKRLCGAAGGGAGGYTGTGPSKTGQWYIACSAGDTKAYPYDDVYDGKKCNSTDYMGSDAMVDAGSIPTCEGGYPGIFDLSGNVSEWEDACEGQTGKDDMCQDRNGTYNYGKNEQACSYTWRDPREAVWFDVGFRCCADIP